MFRSFIPFAHAQTIYEIDPSFFKKCGVKVLLADLDNTLDSYRLMKPLPHAFELVGKLKDAGIEMVVVSNNHGERVTSYATSLGVRFIASTGKPFARKINAFLRDNHLAKDEVMLVGDQMMTDVLAAHNAGIRVVLTEKIVKEDQWTTHINRIFGRKIRKYHQKHGNLRDWRKIYGND